MDTPAVNEEKEIILDAHRSGDWLIIDYICVPPPLPRGQGLGTAFYREWEAKLPPEITLLLLWAAGDGTGASERFWERQGFSYRYEGEDLDYDSTRWMWKGVNGHPTPDPIHTEPEA